MLNHLRTMLNAAAWLVRWDDPAWIDAYMARLPPDDQKLVRSMLFAAEASRPPLEAEARNHRWFHLIEELRREHVTSCGERPSVPAVRHSDPVVHGNEYGAVIE